MTCLIKENQDVNEKITQEKNSFRINTKNKLTSKDKKELKTHGCQFLFIHGSYVCPIENKELIRNLLTKKNINAELIDIDNPFPKKSNKINSLESQLYILESEVYKENKELLICANEISDEEGNPMRLFEFEEPPLESDIQYLKKMNIYERVKANKEKEKKINSLREDIKRFENEELENEKIIERLYKNESGDSEIFVELFKDKYIFDPTEGKNGVFYMWNGKQWVLDIHKERYQDFEKVADAYQVITMDENIDDETSKALLKRAEQLRTGKRRNSVLETSSAYLSFKHSWDSCHEKLPCANGLVDLKTGRLESAKKENYIKKICPINYNESATCPTFIKFLNDITLGDKELSDFISRLIGYTLLGVPKEEKIFYFYGDGRNGKGTLMHIMQHILGPLSKTFPSEMLLSQRNPPSSSSPNPELANLEGVRMAVFSEINEGRKIDSAKVKNLSGRDIIPCRRLFSNVDLQITPTHTMIIQTNYKPKASSDDKALWSRNILIPFKARFVKDPKKENQNELCINESLKDDLLKESEGILKWMVDGCIEYQRNGLQIPQSVIDQTEEYRKENDEIGCFLEEMCILDPAFTTQKEKMEIAIKEYCKANGMKEPNRQEISNYLKEKFQEGKTNKMRYWKGIKIRDR